MLFLGGIIAFAYPDPRFNRAGRGMILIGHQEGRILQHNKKSI
ncbi:MAG: hypothetical protein Metus_1030 [Candidatus Methanosuratincola subterraneus]|uniref:Uncharacterized protein n=1 Tax=Methanosuratincola subterraneus TaxID=2593994 RepID=A0A3S3RE44_METS7|nr:MAG: hypothetical protein Metus_1030 [Candidatus Methanosuratincola subterraneus]